MPEGDEEKMELWELRQCWVPVPARSVVGLEDSQPPGLVC